MRCGSARPWVSHPWLGYIPPTAPTCLGLEQGGLGPRAMLPRHWSARGGGARAAPRRRHAVDLHGEEFTSLDLGDATAMATLSGKKREKPWDRERGREGRSHERTSSHRIPGRVAAAASSPAPRRARRHLPREREREREKKFGDGEKSGRWGDRIRSRNFYLTRPSSCVRALLFATPHLHVGHAVDWSAQVWFSAAHAVFLTVRAAFYLGLAHTPRKRERSWRDVPSRGD